MTTNKKSRPAEDRTAHNKSRINSYLGTGEDESYFGWKVRLENTVNGDPDAPKAGLKVLRCYLEFASEENHPYRAMADLVAETGLDERTVARTRTDLVRLGYMIEAGREPSGAMRYRLQNPRAKIVFDHVENIRQELRQREADKKNRTRAKVSEDEFVPGKNEGDTASDPASEDMDVPRKNAGDVPHNFARAVPPISAGESLEDTFDYSNEGEPPLQGAFPDHPFMNDGMDDSSSNDHVLVDDARDPDNAPSDAPWGASGASSRLIIEESAEIEFVTYAAEDDAAVEFENDEARENFIRYLRLYLPSSVIVRLLNLADRGELLVAAIHEAVDAAMCEEVENA